MSKVYSASPSSHAPSTSQQTGIYAERSSASLGTPGLQQHAPSPFPKATYAPAEYCTSSSHQALEDHHSFSALYRGSQAEARQAATAGAEPSLQTRGLQAELSPADAGGGGGGGDNCDGAVPPRQGVGEAQGSGAVQPQSPRAATRLNTSGGVDTPKTLRLKAMAAQTERLQQVWTVLCKMAPSPVNCGGSRTYEVLAVVGCTAVFVQFCDFCTHASAAVKLPAKVVKQGCSEESTHSAGSF